jgi:glycosyltransferase involved in cell wall biosynthesis
LKIAAVIPAYNEAQTIQAVVKAARGVPAISEVIVVSDGSTDETTTLAREAGAQVIDLPENQGKAAAMRAGVMASSADQLLFLDADLIGLTPAHIESLIAPVLAGEADMAVGIFDEGRFSTDLAQVIAPYLSGQRIVPRSLLLGMFQDPEIDHARYGIEVALTLYAKELGLRVVEVGLPEMSHRMKEEKLGLVKGMAARLKMYYEILKYVQQKR